MTNISWMPGMMMKYRIEGEGRPIVLVPGGLTGCISWEEHARRLASTRKVIRVQLLSVDLGLLNRPLPDDYSLAMEAAALGRTLDAILLDQAVDLVAWSYGAAITLHYALDHPDRIRTLTLIEPPAIWVLGPEQDFPEMERLRQLGEGLVGVVSEAQLETFVHVVGIVPPGTNAKLLPQWPLWMRYRRSLLNTSAVFQHHDDPERLSSFQPPVLLVKGTGSADFLHAVIDVLAARLPNNEVTEMPAGHAPHLVSLERFLAELAAFQERKGTIE